MASTMSSTSSSMDWLQQQPATPPRTEEQHSFPPSLHWWPPTPGSTEEGMMCSAPGTSPGFASFASFSKNPSFLNSSPFLQPFFNTLPTKQHQYSTSPGHQGSAHNQPHTLPPHLSNLSPFSALSAFPSTNQSPLGMFSPPPSNARSSPSPCDSTRNSPQSSFAQPRGVLKRNSFLKLPPEVRALIYQELVPETEIHVTMDPMSGKLFSYHCQDMEDSEYVGRHWFAMSESEYRKLGVTPRTCGHLACVKIGPRMRGLGGDERGWVSLASTCKAIRDEFSPYLYARPRFMFEDVASLRRFLETADTERLRYFTKTINLSYLIPECPNPRSESAISSQLSDWDRVWQGLAMMHGLKYIAVSLIARGAFANRDYESRVLKPLMQLSGKRRVDGKGGKLEVFDLVSFEGTRKCRLPAEFDDAPFKYIWQSWTALGGPELERVARRFKQFIDAQPPYWHHLSSYHRHAFYGGGDLNVRSLFSVM